MAGLSIDELRRLARNFLIGKGGEAELEDTKRAMESDPQLAMEFLQQMQTALDDVAPSGFNQAQWNEIEVRYRALIAPLAKGGFGLGFIGRIFSKLFGKRPPAEAAPARIKSKSGPPEAAPKPAGGEAPTSLLSSEAVVAPPSAVASEGMEDMAPIAPVSAEPAAPAPEAAVEPAPEPEAEPRPSGSGRAKIALQRALAALLGLALLAALGWGGRLGWNQFRAWQARRNVVAPPAPTPIPTPAPTPYDGPARRSRPPAWQEEPLPSELPPLTPRPAGRVDRPH